MKASWNRFSLAAPAVLAVALATACPPPPPLGAVYVSARPPVARVEVLPGSPGPEFVWVGGYWTWSGREYVWTGGRWERRPHARAVWVPGRWRHHSRGWYWVEGRWK